MIDTRVILGQGLDSSSFHTVELPQIMVKKFQMFELTSEKQLKQGSVDKIAKFNHTTVKTVDLNSFASGAIDDQMIDFEQFLSWLDLSFTVPQKDNLY